MVVQSFRCLPELGLAYLTNAKSGSTTIKYSLLAAAAERAGDKPEKIDPHRRDTGPFVENIFRHPLFGSPKIREITVFSAVRNPFVRALSGYLDKVGTKDPAWLEFAGQFGIRPEIGTDALGFTEYLRLLDTQFDERINAHFRPQYVNLLLPFSAPRFIGRLEAFDETVRFLGQAGVPMANRRGRSVRAEARLAEHYTDEAEALVARKFAPDFELFGYSPKLADVRALQAPTWKDSDSDLLMDWLSGGAFPAEHVDPIARAQHAIRAEDSLESKIARIREVYKTEQTCKRLVKYAALARQAGKSRLLANLEERITMLRSTYRACVNHRDIFAPAERRPGTEKKKLQDGMSAIVGR